ncbi:MAG TPA: molybdopterin-dependent oxidoreductase [Nitrospiraceae bacterium]|jgi:DMSO/TMAO reductase YedYZ molybdopterin-dependent catalytic subunit|nr:molybdopterin-dependent oxidoreductase [Nitrospiraceae bacterium]
MTRNRLGRRQLLKAAAGVAGIMASSGCDNLSRSEWVRQMLGHTEAWTERVQRALTPANALAKEYEERDISAVFPPNGNTHPGTSDYVAKAERDFVDWQVGVTGLVAKPATWSLAELRAMPSRTQITRHDCVEGWSAIGKWTGVPLGDLMHLVEPLPEARYVVFHCADSDDEGAPYYESVALQDAYHPQTLLAYDLNGTPLDIPHGAPIRLRIERQLGYKHAKYVMGLELVASLAGIGGGKGGYWEDQGYEWYAGI